jgi:hypothetical protein
MEAPAGPGIAASLCALIILLLLAGAIAWSVWNTLKKDKELQK